jgi:hypothetical protein
VDQSSENVVKTILLRRWLRMTAADPPGIARHYFVADPDRLSSSKQSKSAAGNQFPIVHDSKLLITGKSLSKFRASFDLEVKSSADRYNVT